MANHWQHITMNLLFCQLHIKIALLHKNTRSTVQDKSLHSVQLIVKLWGSKM